MKPIYFPTQQDMRDWLEEHHDKEDELLLCFYKKDSGKPSITWPQSVDEALCFGWIDGVRKSVDETRYTIRFTPRRKKSIWSAVNIQRVGELIKLGLMKPEGMEAFGRRDEERSRIYAYERKTVSLDPVFDKQLKKNKKALQFFQSQAPSYQKIAVYWVMSAKQEETRLRRLETLIKDSEAGLRIPSQRWRRNK